MLPAALRRPARPARRASSRCSSRSSSAPSSAPGRVLRRLGRHRSSCAWSTSSSRSRSTCWSSPWSSSSARASEHLHRDHRWSAGCPTPASSAARSWSPSGRTTCWPRSPAACPNLRIMGRHLLPNVITQAIIYAMSDIVQDILAIVTLGYLGLGIPPPTADWGTMIADGQNFLTTHWQLTTIPGLAVVVTGLGAVADRRRPRRPAPAGPDDVSSTDTGTLLCRSATCLCEIRRQARPRPRGRWRLLRRAPRASAVGLVGESGSGKSMTLRAILGVLPPGAQVTAGRGPCSTARTCSSWRIAAQQAPRPGDRDDLPGADDRAQPGHAGRAARSPRARGCTWA